MKKVIMIVLALALLFSISACEGTKTPAPAAESAPAAEPAEAPTEEPTAEADDTVYNLSASFHSPETNSSVIYTKAWCEEITEASGGRIKWTYYTSASLTSSSETFTHTKEGVCDLSWTTPVLVGAYMKANSLLNTPNVGWPINADGGEIAWKIFEQSEAIQKEWEGVKVISYYPMGATVLATSDKAIASGADTKGLNIRATNAVNSAFMASLGATPVIVSTSDVYENLQKNVIDGSLIDWNLFSSFHLYDVMKYAVQDTLYSNVGNIIMNINTYNSLPADLQAIIDEHSGVYASRMGGQLTQELDEQFMQDCISKGVTVVPADDTLKADYAVAGQAALDAFYKDCESAEVDADALVELCIKEFAALGYESPIFSK